MLALVDVPHSRFGEDQRVRSRSTHGFSEPRCTCDVADKLTDEEIKQNAVWWIMDRIMKSTNQARHKATASKLSTGQGRPWSDPNFLGDHRVKVNAKLHGDRCVKGRK